MGGGPGVGRGRHAAISATTQKPPPVTAAGTTHCALRYSVVIHHREEAAVSLLHLETRELRNRGKNKRGYYGSPSRWFCLLLPPSWLFVFEKLLTCVSWTEKLPKINGSAAFCIYDTASLVPDRERRKGYPPFFISSNGESI